MIQAEGLDDPLKSIDDICRPNMRQKLFQASLENLHAELPTSIALREGVPWEVTHIPPPTAKEVEQAVSEIDVVDILVITPKLRNRLAHGSTTLHPNSPWMLCLVSGAIAQLFPAERTDV